MGGEVQRRDGLGFVERCAHGEGDEERREEQQACGADEDD